MNMRAGVLLAAVFTVCAAAAAAAAGDLNPGTEVTNGNRKLLTSCPKHHETATKDGRRICGAHTMPVLLDEHSLYCAHATCSRRGILNAKW